MLAGSLFGRTDDVVLRILIKVALVKWRRV
jgi:hypothetical protein